ncbi:MAG TPA: HAMP domain-containing sensor histidine kinase [Candidatus Acidoferrales bacterium]|nr:HAMP domain-containing sensor histidine kinase [Candidatus Acidoferrales bacterium]
MENTEALSSARPPVLRRLSNTSWVLVCSWVVLVGSYAVVALTARHSRQLTAFGDIGMCLVALFGTAALLLNVRAPSRRARAFWILLAAGCASWLVSQLVWTYFEIVLRQEVPNPFLGDVIVFLHPVPMIAALALRPHESRDDLNVRASYIDFSLLVAWWVYLYMFVVIPWQYVSPNVLAYGQSYDDLAIAENFLLVLGFASLLFRAKGKWREIYAHLFSASLMYAAGSFIANRAIDVQTYYTGGPADLPLVGSFVWFGTAGIVAYSLKPKPAETPANAASDSRWPARFAMIAVFSIPLMSLWTILFSHVPHTVAVFRIEVAQSMLIVAATLLFIRQRLVDRDRLRLLSASQEALDDLKHFQQQMVQNEKLVSIGQLAAGAAHEINNPLTGILGYSDLLADDANLTERQRASADKIRTLARRIKTLVTSLLSFARRVPSEKTLLDLNQVIETALNLNNLSLRDKKIDVEILPDADLPQVRGDANQLLQVCFNLMSNAVDALDEIGGGKLTIHTDHDPERVVVEFSDTGPGMASPQQVFDPFFTTKPVGKGTGLGLSICYGIVQEHSGRISCRNRPEGGATFTVEFPVAADGGSSSSRSPVGAAKSVS